MAAAGATDASGTRHHEGMDFDDTAALIVIDVQQGFDDPAWGARDNPDAEANIGRARRSVGGCRRPIVLVRHDSASPGSPLGVGSPGNALKDVVADAPHDLFVTKQVNSAFYGEPDLHAWLQAAASGSS